MFYDNDSVAVNLHTTYEILNDEFEIFRPECKAFEADQAGLKASAVNCSRSLNLYKTFFNNILLFF